MGKVPLLVITLLDFFFFCIVKYSPRDEYFVIYRPHRVHTMRTVFNLKLYFYNTYLPLTSSLLVLFVIDKNVFKRFVSVFLSTNVVIKIIIEYYHFKSPL